MAAEVHMPVRLRIGSGDEFEVGTLTVSNTEDIAGLDMQLVRALRAVADDIESRWQEVNPDAAAHG